MNTLKYLQLLQQEIHTVIFATIDKENHPVTCVVDIMLSDENGLYFLTAKGKSFYERLTSHPYISLTGYKGKDTLSSQSITLQGMAREIGQERLSEIFEFNPYMTEIYPTPISQTALTVFQIYKGSGEFFDLSSRPIFRESFSFGNMNIKSKQFIISDSCTACSKCLDVCPQNCINSVTNPFEINQSHCLHCGKCAEICPEKAIEKRSS